MRIFLGIMIGFLLCMIFLGLCIPIAIPYHAERKTVFTVAEKQYIFCEYKNTRK